MSNAKTFLAGIVLFFGVMIYFAYEFTKVYPPLKKYEYSQSMPLFAKDLKGISMTNPNITFNITDTAGSAENGYAYYFTLNIKGTNKDNEYRIAYKQDDD